MQNFDELAERYLGAVEKQKMSEGTVGVFTRGDMETCFVAGAQSMEVLQEGCEGTFGQAIGSLKRGSLVRRKGWNGGLSIPTARAGSGRNCARNTVLTGIWSDCARAIHSRISTPPYCAMLVASVTDSANSGIYQTILE